MSCQTAFPKICGYYLSASIITLEASASSCKSEDRTDQRVQSLMFMMMMMIMTYVPSINLIKFTFKLPVFCVLKQVIMKKNYNFKENRLQSEEY